MTIRPIDPPTDMVGNKEATLPTSRSLEVNNFSLKKKHPQGIMQPNDFELKMWKKCV